MGLEDPLWMGKNGANALSFFAAFIFLGINLLLAAWFKNNWIFLSVLIFNALLFLLVALIPLYCINYTTEVVFLRRPIKESEKGELLDKSLGQIMDNCNDLAKDCLQYRIPRGARGEEIKKYFIALGAL